MVDRGGHHCRRCAGHRPAIRADPTYTLASGTSDDRALRVAHLGSDPRGRPNVRLQARRIRYTSSVIRFQLTCSAFWVDVRLRESSGRWVASADTPDRPSLGLGLGAVEAIEGALKPFEGLVEELLASLPGSAIR